MLRKRELELMKQTQYQKEYSKELFRTLEREADLLSSKIRSKIGNVRDTAEIIDQLAEAINVILGDFDERDEHLQQILRVLNLACDILPHYVELFNSEVTSQDVIGKVGHIVTTIDDEYGDI